MKRDIEMDSSWDLQKARFLDSWKRRSKSVINVSSYQQNLFSHLFPILLFQPMSSTNDAQLQRMESWLKKGMVHHRFGNHVVRTKIFEASYDLGRSFAMISRIMPLKNQGFKPGGSRTCIWPAFRPMFCRCSAGGKKPDAKNDHFDGRRSTKMVQTKSPTAESVNHQPLEGKSTLEHSLLNLARHQIPTKERFHRWEKKKLKTTTCTCVI